MLAYWLYISTAKVPSRSVDDALIYLQAYNRNRAHGITGYLHREGDHYVQYVEGPPEEMAALRKLIRKDWRHTSLCSLDEGTRDTRLFEGWDMAFTPEETTSFWAFQTMRRCETDIAKASTADILAFMKATATNGQARTMLALAA